MLILICCSVAQPKKVKMGTCRSRKNSDHFQTTKRRIPRMASPTQIPRKMMMIYGYAFLAGKQMRGNIITVKRKTKEKRLALPVLC